MFRRLLKKLSFSNEKGLASDSNEFEAREQSGKSSKDESPSASEAELTQQEIRLIVDQEIFRRISAYYPDYEVYGDYDAFFVEAARIVVASQQGSISLLQRKLSIGYSRAVNIMDQLEAAGIVGPFEGSAAREVLISDPSYIDRSISSANKDDEGRRESILSLWEDYIATKVQEILQEKSHEEERRELELAKNELLKRERQKTRRKLMDQARQELIDEGLIHADEAGATRRTIPQAVKNQVWTRDNGKCVICGSSERLEFDHIIPLAKGGANTYRNLQLLCEKCNRSKGARI